MKVKNSPHMRPFIAALLAIGIMLPAAASAQTQPASEAGPSAPAASAPASPAIAAPPVSVPVTATPTAPAAPAEAPSPAASPGPPGPSAALTLPRDLSPWGMFMAADIVVKAVMIGLAFASVLTWTVWFAKAIELLIVRRRMQATIDALSQARSWSEASARIKGRNDGSAALVRAADAELRLSTDALSPSGVKERIASRREHQILGTGKPVRAQLRALAASCGAEELSVVSITHEFRQRVRCYELLMQTD